MLGEATGDVDGVADLDRRRLVGVPQDGGDAAGAVGERQAEVRRAVALLAAFDRADEQHGVDGAAVLQVAHRRRCRE